jgi:hypothetical protein
VTQKLGSDLATLDMALRAEPAKKKLQEPKPSSAKLRQAQIKYMMRTLSPSTSLRNNKGQGKLEDASGGKGNRSKKEPEADSPSSGERRKSSFATTRERRKSLAPQPDRAAQEARLRAEKIKAQTARLGVQAQARATEKAMEHAMQKAKDKAAERIERSDLKGAAEAARKAGETRAYQNQYSDLTNRAGTNEAMDGVTKGLWKLAMRAKIPYDIFRAAWDIFRPAAKMPSNVKSFSDNYEEDLLQEGTMNTHDFAECLCKLAKVDSQEDLPDGFLYSCFAIADSDGSDRIDFAEFAIWYSRFGFSESLLLVSEEQKEIRAIARKQGVLLCDIEHYKKMFNSYADKTGEISQPDFKLLLSALLKLPPSLDLPDGRIRQFWAETDVDKSGSIGFEEFVEFYKKYFRSDHQEKGFCPLRAFYRAARPCAMMPQSHH